MSANIAGPEALHQPASGGRSVVSLDIPFDGARVLRLPKTFMLSHFTYIFFAQELDCDTIASESVSENPPVCVHGI